MPGGQHELAGPRSRHRRGDGVRTRRAGARPRPEGGHLRPDLVQAAGTKEGAKLPGEQVEHAVVGQGVGLQRRLEGRTRPSQSTKLPAFSACGATGSMTSAYAVTLLGRW